MGIVIVLAHASIVPHLHASDLAGFALLVVIGVCVCLVVRSERR